MRLQGPIKAKPFFVAMIVLLLASVPFYFLEWIYPGFLGLNGLSFFLFALANLGEAICLILALVKIDKIPPSKMATYFARYEFAVNPIVAFSVLSLSAIFPQAPRNWLYFFNMGMTVVLILARGWAVVWLHLAMKKGDTGYLPFRNHSYILMSLSFIILNYYVISIWKTSDMDVSIIYEGGGSFAGFSDFFLMMTVLEIGVGIIVLLQSLFIAISNHYAGKEDKVIDLRLNAHQSKEMLERYDVPFWIGIFSLFLMFVLAAASLFAAPEAYAPIAFLYFVVLLTRLLIYFGVTAVKKRGKTDKRRIFKREHVIILLAALFFAAYAVLCIVFGRRAFERMGEVAYTVFIVFGIFVPWSVIKLGLGAYHYLKARKKGDPAALTNAFVDILLSIYTIAHTFAIVAVKAHMEGFKITAIVLAVILSVYCLYIAVRMGVIGILGLAGKREKAWLRFQKEEEFVEVPAEADDNSTPSN